MDYFNGLKNEDFKNYFLKDLNSLDELTQYVYPNESIEENEIIDDHIIRCQNILETYILKLLAGNDDLTNDQINKLFDQKRIELIPFLLPDIEIYFNKVKVKIIDLS